MAHCRRPMTEEQLPHQMQAAKCMSCLETLHFGALKAIYFSTKCPDCGKTFLTEMKGMYKYI